MKFVDLFAGLGGFHHGLLNAGNFKCVFASEIDEELRNIYKINYGLKPQGDITKIDESTIPSHDLLCAGFPCQPFSLAGAQEGVKCLKSGRFIDDIIRIAKHSRPSFFILENVPNILTIDNGSFWSYIRISFENLGYKIIHKIISPDEIGIPHNRKRLFIIGSANSALLDNFVWPLQREKNELESILDQVTTESHIPICKEKLYQLVKWQCLLNDCSIKVMPSISICAPEFGATYPLDFSDLEIKHMKIYKGSYGISLKSCKTWLEILERLPSYVRKKRIAPSWMVKSIQFSRSIYENNDTYIDCWQRNLQKNYNSWQILEWRGHRNYLDFDEHLIQFRASGIRIMKATRAPSLVSMTSTQIPIIGSQMRYLSRCEAAKLQNLHHLKVFPKNNTSAFKSFGNAVNAKIVELIGKQLNITMNLYYDR